MNEETVISVEHRCDRKGRDARAEMTRAVSQLSLRYAASEYQQWQELQKRAPNTLPWPPRGDGSGISGWGWPPPQNPPKQDDLLP